MSEWKPTQFTRDDGIKIESRGATWAIVGQGGVWDKVAKEFVYEPMPSNREDDFLARCRFDSLDEAMAESPTDKDTL